MKYPIHFAWQRYRYLPYEKRLAAREVETLVGLQPQPAPDGLEVSSSTVPKKKLERLTYFESVRINGSRTVVPLQAKLEATSLPPKVVSGDLFGSFTPARSSSKQSTRYSAHGLHDYRGKFNPQIVRACANILELPRNAWVLDPFCGSGTVMLECAHGGWNAIGVDRNPLAVLISNAKLAAISIDEQNLRNAAIKIARRLRPLAQSLDYESSFDRLTERKLRSAISLPNRAYLERWFPRSVLLQLAVIRDEIDRLDDALAQNITTVVLSDILRSVSLQDPGDLRIRRRKDPRDNYPAIPQFLRELKQRVDTILRARDILPKKLRGCQKAFLGDSCRGIPEEAGRGRSRFDAAITSPPYATALPYIDTQRLSLAFLGLVTEQEIRHLERSLVGNREISDRERAAEEEMIRQLKDELPTSVKKLCRQTLQSAGKPGNGFRRRNIPALLFRYFHEMQLAFVETLKLIKPGGRFAFVAGPNRTVLAGKEFKVDTPMLLADTADHVGWSVDEILPLDTYQRFDVHRRNSITKEALVILRRPTQSK